MALYKILSIDGGGMNALVCAVVLAKLEELLIEYSGKKDASLCDFFDFFTGTSAGGILTGAYLCPIAEGSTRPLFTAKNVIDEYIKIGKKIFKQPVLRTIYSLWGLTESKYPSSRLTKAFIPIFGDTKLSECLKPCLIPAYNIASGKCIFYDRENAKAYTERDYYLRDVLRATSSAPSYFPPAVISAMSGKESCMIDGGVFANNPSMCGLVELDKMTGCGAVCGKNVAVVSVGLGIRTDSINCSTAMGWGKVGWALPVLSILMNAVSQTTDYQLRKIFASDFTADTKYMRIDGAGMDNLPCLGPMDDASDKNIENCIRYGEILAEAYCDRMQSFAKMLVAN